MRARLVSSRPPWWLAAVPWIAAIALGYLLVVLSAATDEALVAIAYCAALTSAMLVVTPLPGGRETPRDIELELAARFLRLGRTPWARRLDERDVLGLRVNARPGCHEIIVDLGRGAPLVLEVDDERTVAAVVGALGGQRAATSRVTFATGTPPGTREARAVAVTGLGLLVSAALAGALDAIEAHVLVTSGITAALYATVRGIGVAPSRSVALDPRALHTPRARVPLETVTRVEESDDHVRVETDRSGAIVIPVEIGTLHGDVTQSARSLLARSIACAVRERRPHDARASTTQEHALATHLRRGDQSAREWLSSLDAFAERARVEGGYRATLDVDDLETLATDDRTDDEIRIAATRVLYRIAPDIAATPAQSEPRLMRVATEDEDEALDALADLARRKAWL